MLVMEKMVFLDAQIVLVNLSNIIVQMDVKKVFVFNQTIPKLAQTVTEGIISMLKELHLDMIKPMENMQLLLIFVNMIL